MYILMSGFSSVGTNSSSDPSSDETTPDTPTDGEEEEEKTWPDKWPYQKIYGKYKINQTDIIRARPRSLDFTQRLASLTGFLSYSI